MCIYLGGATFVLIWESVSFGTEAGVFNNLNIDTIVCGPGNINQAHKPDEFIEIKQIKKCKIFIENLLESLC